MRGLVGQEPNGCILSIPDGPVVHVVIDRHEVRNALSSAALRELRDHLVSALADPDVRVVVLTGTGNHFCAGADLHEPIQDFEPFTHEWMSTLRTITHTNKPVVARINGDAY